MPRLLVISKHANSFQELIVAAGLPGLDASYCDTPEAALAHCAETEILFGAPDRLVPVLPHCGKLRWLQSSWAGVKPLIDAPRRDYQLTGVKDIFGPLMTEYVLGWLLALERNIMIRGAARQWDDRPDGRLAGKQIGIMGTGSIGRHLAQACRFLGLHTRGLNSDGRLIEGFDECYASPERLRFASELDYLVTLLPDTGSSDRLVDRGLLACLNPGAVLVNGGRANCIEQAALLDALASGALRHAVLDVLPSEPLPEEDPLWQVENLSITSHTAAPTPAQAIVDIFCENYRRYSSGEPLLYAIDFERGY